MIAGDLSYSIAGDLFAGCELVAKCSIDESCRDHGYAQVTAVVETIRDKGRTQSRVDPLRPLLVHPNGGVVEPLRRDLQRIRDLFPPLIATTKSFPSMK